MKTIFVYLYLHVLSIGVGSQDPIGLKVSSMVRGLPFGAAVGLRNLRNNADNGQFITHLKKNAYILVPENELKPQQIWLGENQYAWNESDWLLGSTANSYGWAQQNNFQVRGHTLVWAVDKYTPQWLLRDEALISSEKAKTLLQNYIYAVVGRYQGKIGSWDVVNEAVDDQGNNGRSFNIRDCFWYRKLGSDFVKYAFMFAKQADSKAQLYYNDYSIENLNSKANHVLDLITWARAQGAIVNGIGMQWHVGLWAKLQPGDSYYRNAERWINHGLDIMVTELDVGLSLKDGQVADPNDLEQQAQVYRSIVKYALHFSPKCRALITWGFTDRYSWIPWFSQGLQGAALPLDSNYQPKPAFLAMQEEFNRMIPDGVYYLSPLASLGRCLEMKANTDLAEIELTSCTQSTSQKWNIKWLNDGTYQIAPVSIQEYVLGADNEYQSEGEIKLLTQAWWNKDGKKWIFSPIQQNFFRLAPSTTWWRALTCSYSTKVMLHDFREDSYQQWSFQKA